MRRFPIRLPRGLLKAAGLLAAFGLLAGCSDSPTRSSVDCTASGNICTAMGTGQRAYAGEGDVPSKVSLYYPIDVLFDPEGRLLVLDWNNLRIRRLDQDGKVRTIMGTGFEDNIIEGTPAIDTPLHHAFSVTFDGAGNYYVAGNHVPKIIRVDTEGIVHIVAGLDTPGDGGDGGPALLASLDSPCGVAVAPAGFPIWLADTNNHRIRVVGSDGMIHTLAGNGAPGYSGDGGPSERATLRRPYRVRLDAGTGSLYVSDTENHAIRRIDASGVITTVAGTGEAGFSGDGGPAAQAQLTLPYDAAIGPDGALYIADGGNHRIRRVDAEGVIRTIAGKGSAGFSGDGGSAMEAELDHPLAFAFDATGGLWIADSYNSRIRKIAP
jgi:sugar lactone lactonase YvrE